MDAVVAATAWFDRREPPPPAALAGRIRLAVALGSGDVGGDAADRRAVAVVLAEAALGRLHAALETGRDRAAALDLLAADALLTYAFEAAAEAGPDAVVSLAGEYGPRRLALLIPGHDHEEPHHE